jgi:hypothetical protein
MCNHRCASIKEIGIGDREIRLPPEERSRVLPPAMAEEALLMSLYRCRFFRFVDRTLDAFQIQGLACENDAEAIGMARRMSANSRADGFELWKDDRCVHIEPQTT